MERLLKSININVKTLLQFLIQINQTLCFQYLGKILLVNSFSPDKFKTRTPRNKPQSYPEQSIALKSEEVLFGFNEWGLGFFQRQR